MNCLTYDPCSIPLLKVTLKHKHCLCALLFAAVQAIVTNDDPEEAFAQLQEPLSVASPWAMPPLLMPLVVAAPFGSGKRAVLQKLVKMLPDVFAVPRVVTSKPRTPGSSEGVYSACRCCPNHTGHCHLMVVSMQKECRLLCPRNCSDLKPQDLHKQPLHLDQQTPNLSPPRKKGEHPSHVNHNDCRLLFLFNAIAADMEVISAELAQQMVQEGKFLVHQAVMGHTYGISAAAVRKLQASGKLPVLDLDRVADVARLKESGFQVSCACCQHSVLSTFG